MPFAAPGLIVAAASGLYLLSALIRALRLYLCLGQLRGGFVFMAFLHFSGVVAGHFCGPLAYELVVVLGCSCRHWERLLPVLISLMILRGFDAVIMIALALAQGGAENTGPLVLFLFILLLFLSMCIYSVKPILLRFERNIIELPAPFAKDVALVAFSHRLRVALAKLPWEKPGTIAIVTALSLMAWLLEWLAVFLFSGDITATHLAVIGRVGSGVGLLPNSGAELYASLMPAIIAAACVLAACCLGRLTAKRTKRDSKP